MTQAKPNKQKIARMIASEFQHKYDAISVVNDTTINAEYEVIMRRKGRRQLCIKFEKAEAIYRATKADVRAAFDIAVDSAKDIARELRYQIKRRQEMSGVNKDAVAKLRREERLLLSQLELAATTQDIEHIMRRAGLLDEVKKGV
jgi:hypothetical protein